MKDNNNKEMETGAVTLDLINRRKRYAYRRQGIKYFTIILFLIPPLFIFIVFVIWPVIQAAYFSLYRWNGLGPMTNFQCFNNFIRIFNDDIFRKALFNNIALIFLSLTIQLPTALVLAIIIGRRLKGRIIFRALFFLPFILAEVIVGVVWRFIYNPQYGLVYSVLRGIIPDAESISLLGNPDTVFLAIFAVIWWKYFGLHMVIYIAGLQNVPEELEEAASIDGASPLQVIWHVVLPSLRPTIQISVFFCIIGSFQQFDIVWAMGKGDPVHAAELMVTYLFKFGFQRFSLGYGSAIAIVIFFICLGFNIAYQRILIQQARA